VLDPAMAWQAFMTDVAFGEPWNNLPINQSKILHFHSSRGSDSRVELMKSIAKQIGTVTVDPSTTDSMKPVFEDIIRNHRWSDVVCGTGSTIEHTQPLREQLVPFLKKHNINSMADIPCGDFSWMSQVEFPKDFYYIGGDIVGFMIEQARQKYPGVELLEFDLSQDTIHKVDLIFCRDCLFHFSLADLNQTLDNISRSSVKYVMFTSYYDGVNHDITTGAFREIDFLKAPFEFPEPIDFIHEDIPSETRKRRLCLWSIDTIREYVKQ
jgi:SAM-dependent methyltransferase